MERGGAACDFPCLLGGCQCDNQFTFCLRSYGGSRGDDASFCDLGSPEVTDSFSNSDAMSFEDVTDLGSSVSNPVVYRGGSWPVSHLVAIVACL